jgi:hypothetical protein
MDVKQNRKDLVEQYKQRKVVGGVYLIRNTINGKIAVEATVDMPGSQNRFAFAQSTGSGTIFKLQKDWLAMGGSAFVLEVLETIEKKESQTDKEFKEDVQTLKEIWLEKLAHETFY